MLFMTARPELCWYEFTQIPRGGAPKGWRFINARLPRQKAVAAPNRLRGLVATF